MRRVLQVLFWLAMAVAFTMATLPHPPDPGITSDKLEHFLTFATLAALGSAAYPRNAWRITLGLFVFGALIEFAQMIPLVHRDADIVDWLVDAAGTLLILLAVAGWRRLAAKA
jgi:VanZ family protein